MRSGDLCGEGKRDGGLNRGTVLATRLACDWDCKLILYYYFFSPSLSPNDKLVAAFYFFFNKY